MECLNTEILCLYLDNELDTWTHHDVAAHLSRCQSCADKLRALQEDDARLRESCASRRAPEASGHACYRAEDLSAYASGLLTSWQTAGVEQHLHTCDTCLGEVMALHKTLRQLQRNPLLAPPARLVTAAQRAFAGGEHPSVLEKLGALIIQVATEGLRFVEAALLPADVRITIGGHLLPAPAFRSMPEATGAAAFLDIQQKVRDLVLHIGALHEDGETVLLKVQLYKQGSPLARQRVSLLSHGRLLDGLSPTVSRGVHAAYSPRKRRNASHLALLGGDNASKVKKLSGRALVSLLRPAFSAVASGVRIGRETTVCYGNSGRWPGLLKAIFHAEREDRMRAQPFVIQRKLGICSQ
jgi:hypothetical protein